MPEPFTTLGLAKTASEVFKEAMSFAREAKNIELSTKLVDLYRDFLELVETNQQLRGEIADLKKRPDIAAKLRHLKADGSYYLRQDDGKEDGPFCTTCWDVDGRLVHQTKSPGEPIYCGYCVRTTKKR
jgi:hypothetical protein